MLCNIQSFILEYILNLCDNPAINNIKIALCNEATWLTHN